MSELSGRVRGVVNTPTTASASGRWSVRAVNKYVAAGVWPSLPVPGGDFVPLSVVTVPSGTSVASISFNDIPQTYDHLQIRAISKLAGSGIGVFVMRLNNVSTASYAWHRLVGTGSTRVVDSGTSNSEFPVAGAPGSSATNIIGVHVIHLLDYANASKYTTFQTFNGYDTNGSGEILTRSGALFSSTAAVSSIQFYRSSDSFAAPTRFALFGWKSPA